MLGDMKDESAVKPLLNLLQYASDFDGEIPLALGKIGNQKAIEPLQKPHSIDHVLAEARDPDGACYARCPRGRADLIDAIRKTPGAEEGRTSLPLLAQTMGDDGMRLLASLLEQPQICGVAAMALWQWNTPETSKLLLTRLSAPDYEWTTTVVQELVNHHAPSIPSLEELEQNSPQLLRRAYFLEELANCENSKTRSAATEKRPRRMKERSAPEG